MKSTTDKTFVMYVLLVLSIVVVPLQSAQAAPAPFRVVTQSLPNPSSAV